MIVGRLNLEAEQARRRYQDLTTVWNALYGRALSSPEFGTAGQASRLAADAWDLLKVYYDREMDLAATAVNDIARGAHQSVRARIASIDSDELSDAALAHLSETQSYLASEIVAQTHRDIALLRRSLQNAVLTVSARARSTGISERQARVEHLMSAEHELDFHFSDRHARRTPAKSFIGMVWRQALLSTHNEITLLTIADHGIDRAGVFRMEGDEEVQQELISLSGEGGLPAYLDIRNTYFHPNANAYLGLELAHV